ncbi:MAG: hypothetical protein HYY01_00540 [Chloroflexi bacterium]|nr:hypothetical protein [Chloroflexota bacterium]
MSKIKNLVAVLAMILVFLVTSSLAYATVKSQDLQEGWNTYSTYFVHSLPNGWYSYWIDHYIYGNSGLTEAYVDWTRVHDGYSNQYWAFYGAYYVVDNVNSRSYLYQHLVCEVLHTHDETVQNDDWVDVAPNYELFTKLYTFTADATCYNWNNVMFDIVIFLLP